MDEELIEIICGSNNLNVNRTHSLNWEQDSMKVLKNWIIWIREKNKIKVKVSEKEYKKHGTTNKTHIRIIYSATSATTALINTVW